MARQRLQRAYELIGKRIREKRKLRGMPQGVLAEKTGLERPSIVLIEGGKQHLPIDRLVMIAQALDTEPREFLPSLAELDHAARREEVDVIAPALESKDRKSLEKIRQFVKTHSKG